MTKIFFAGDTFSTFIKDDIKLLSEDYDITTLETPLKILDVPKYLIRCLMNVINIKNSNIVWIWFADVPAVPLILISKIFNIPTVVNVGGFEVSGIKDINYGNQLKPIRGWISRWIIRNVTEIIVPSPEYYIKTLKVGIGIKLIDNTFALPDPEDDYYFENYYLTHTMAHISVIPNFIDTRTCDVPLPLKQNIAVTAVCSKFAYDYKGIPIFQRVAGMVPYKTKILEHLPREEYEDNLKRAKVYCQLSRDETFGISLVEAMAYGCVPVVSDKGALSWIVGNAGVIVPYGNAWKTVAGVLEAMHMDGSKARERARYFSRERKQEAVRKLINGMLKPNFGSYPCEPFEV
jgi:glycosyltransferase involved in cell wall biosynthesis